MSAFWAVIGFVAVLAMAAGRRSGHSCVMACTGSAALAVHLLVLGASNMTDEIKCLERLAYERYQAGDDDGCFSLCLEIQRRDPGNARKFYLGGLVAARNGNMDAAASLIAEAARLDDGMAMSALKPGDPCGCREEKP